MDSFYRMVKLRYDFLFKQFASLNQLKANRVPDMKELSDRIDRLQEYGGITSDYIKEATEVAIQLAEAAEAINDETKKQFTHVAFEAIVELIDNVEG